MTVPLPCPQTTSAACDAAPRKRRRRAPASGAADDCFACHKRNVKCDRRRPYCSPCLEIGNDCSGYKTQLTWGVGVASRGKLRGLSLPVAKSAPAVKSPPPRSYTRPRATSSINRIVAEGHAGDDDIEIKIEREVPRLASPYTSYDFVHMNPKSPNLLHSPGPNSDWSSSQEHLHVRSATPAESQGHLLRNSLHRLQPPMVRYGDDLLSPSSAPLSAYSDAEYSPINQPFHVEDVPYMNNQMSMYDSYPQSTPMDHGSMYGTSGDHRGPTSYPEMFYPHSDVSSSLNSHPALFDISESRRLATSPGLCNVSDTDYDEDALGLSHSHSSEQFMPSSHMSKSSWTSVQDDDYSRQHQELSSRIPESLNIGLLPDVSPRLNFYLNYYEKIICPVTVAIDSPSNPYRQHILSLATESQSLQHAICALASCNLRMRRKQSLGQHSWNQPSEERHDFTGSYNIRRPSNTSSASETPLDDASVQEEYHHRSLAVSLLNAQLSSPSLAKHDAVLATLLMLCHYRMCETGIAQFRTQFAGVKKLLGMRSSGVQTGNWGWMESIFTFFDAITATVNDREAQLHGGYLDMIASPWTSSCALENLAGCDGKLFATIASLGRLNLLAQNRPVLDPLQSTHTPPTLNPPPQTSTPILTEFYKQYAQQFPSSTTTSYIEPPPTPPPSSDPRIQFWTEWRTTRHALQTWTFSPSTLLASLHPLVPSPNQIRDFGYVSEAFRHAALLYTERLAAPHLPTGHITMQQHVSQVLFYVTSLGDGAGEGCDAMGKFLLWPLFIAGSEAVGEVERNVVRERCRGIARRGGYGNNQAGLEVLERIWGESEGLTRHEVFAWEKWMREVDGEFIVV
ncbi:hypothetical protein V494_05872 [Pseudogymnoascus sp. VKM F-4513 (FW-928)]|nr:hypothetical protein V494_05872 [Pseudogymnoascus sp. VKM F-4513 (FW-928)]